MGDAQLVRCQETLSFRDPLEPKRARGIGLNGPLDFSTLLGQFHGRAGHARSAWIANRSGNQR